MKITGLQVRLYCYSHGLHIYGKYNPYMGHNTMLTINGLPQEDDGEGHLRQVLPQKGDEVVLTIPSGTLQGTVSDVICEEPGVSIILSPASFTGIFGGLKGGISCYGYFSYEAHPDALVETSISSEPVTYADYMLARHIVESVMEEPVSPDTMQKALRKALAVIRTLRAG